MPRGFASLDDEIVFTGLKHNGKLYVSVYNLSNQDLTITQDFSKYNVKDAQLAYPKSAINEYAFTNGIFTCMLKAKTARAFELE